VRVRFRLEAAADVESARAWYDEQRGGLGDEFIEALEHAIELISSFPNAFPEIAAGHRRALLLRFPYSLYYRVELDVIDVLACLHSSRSPDMWRSRG
jgi:toxin ParE1/3/4